MRVGIIGAGASGLAAAISAARSGAQVIVWEHKTEPGKKILVTGNGRCNLGNEQMDTSWYYSDRQDFVQSTLEKFGTEDTKAFFESLGLFLVSKNGYLYPYHESALGVRDVLLSACKALHVDILTDVSIQKVERMANKKIVSMEQPGDSIRISWIQGKCSNEQTLLVNKVIVAVGGKAAPKTGSDGSFYRMLESWGHHFAKMVPALMSLRCKEAYCKDLAGVRANASLTLMDGTDILAKEQGELQLTDNGVSGIPVFQLSRVAAYTLKIHYELTLLVDFLPQYDIDTCMKKFVDRERLKVGRTVREYFSGMVNQKITELLFKLLSWNPDDPADLFLDRDKVKERTFISLCKAFPFTVHGTNSLDYSQAMAGGISLDEINEDFSSKIVHGVYLVGEVLNVDGKCGGYNLQWAWASGVLAGKAAACFEQ